MAFVASPVVLSPRFQRDALRCAAGRQASFGKRVIGSRSRAEIRAGAPEQISADELEAILKDKPGPLRTSFPIWRWPCTLGRNATWHEALTRTPLGNRRLTFMVPACSLLLSHSHSVCFFCEVVWALSIVSFCSHLWGPALSSISWIVPRSSSNISSLLVVVPFSSNVVTSLKPQLEELAALMDDKIRIVSVDSDDYAECKIVSHASCVEQSECHAPLPPWFANGLCLFQSAIHARVFERCVHDWCPWPSQPVFYPGSAAQVQSMSFIFLLPSSFYIHSADACEVTMDHVLF